MKEIKKYKRLMAHYSGEEKRFNEDEEGIERT
jgi:hypothetical protein